MKNAHTSFQGNYQRQFNFTSRIAKEILHHPQKIKVINVHIVPFFVPFFPHSSLMLCASHRTRRPTCSRRMKQILGSTHFSSWLCTCVMFCFIKKTCVMFSPTLFVYPHIHTPLWKISTLSILIYEASVLIIHLCNYDLLGVVCGETLF